MKKPQVGIVMGSDSDNPIMEETCKVLERFGVNYEKLVSSAHRSPERTRKYVAGAKKRGIKVLVAGAGGAAHLAGVMAAESILPVIGIPIASTPLQGLDSLLSTAQMPGGVPVAAMAVGSAGARNAGILAVQILALGDASLTAKLLKYKKDQAREVELKSRKLNAANGRNPKN
ncbi:MAG: 5-(carboxyamino)imidazole ribonucleotide mutase [Nitrospinae bacterium]|nr:5-(carboxyamino)imidazole ribonucleotide mutase [Nitrospinota bacterium]